jgi:hypothetical protein
VTTAEGQPVERADVRANAHETRGMIGGEERSQKAKTGAGGRCTIEHLLPGTYTVVAEAAGHANGRTEATVTAEQPAEAVIRLGAGGAASGIVVDPDGNPVAGARVGHAMNIEIPLLGDLADQLGGDFLGKVAAGDDLPRTGPDGRFALTGLGYDAPFVVVARHDEFAPGMLKNVRVGATDLRIQLQGPATVTGRAVAAETGEPLADFEVETQAAMFMTMRRTARQQTVTGSADGAFRLTNVTPGDFTLVVSAEDRCETKKSVRLTAGAAIDVGTLAVPRGAMVKGFVRDDQGEPVRNAIVRQKHGGMLDNPILAVLSGGLVARTDGEGRFTLEGLPPGNLLLQASGEGYASARSERIRLEAGQIIEGVMLVLGHGGAIRGRLITAAGERPEEFQLYVKEQQTQDTKIVTPAADGTFHVANLDPGPYEVQAIHPLGVAAIHGGQHADLEDGKSMDFKKMMTAITDSVVTQRCVVQAGEATEVTIDASDLGLGTRLTIQVLVGDKPIGEGMVELVTLADSQVRTAFLDRGECVFGGLRPGAFRAQVRGGITLTPIGGPEEVTIPPNTANHRAILKLPGGELRGRVVDVETGEPLDAVLVRLLHEDRSKDDPIGVAFTDGKGEFAFRALAEGAYALVAADDFSDKGRGAARAENLRVLAGQITDGVVLRAQPAAGVTATVTNEAGTMVPGALVMCVDEHGQPLGTGGLAVSGPDGKAILGGLPGGRARVIARAPGLAPGASDLQDLAPAGHAEFAVRLALGTRVVLEATDRGGRRLAGADVTARCNQGPWFPALLLLERRNQDGGLELGRLTPGDWEFRINHPQTGTFAVLRSIGSGATVSILATPP